jgi:transposase
MPDESAHARTIHNVTPSALGCEECLKLGSAWVHLRLCRTCGHVGCCDSSPNRHEGVVASDPEAIAAFVRLHAPHVARIGLETGATSTWLWTELNRMELPVICIDARHAKAALKMQINKSDRNDAVGIARIMQSGWYKEVRVKGLDSHAIKALLVSRALLVKTGS